MNLGIVQLNTRLGDLKGNASRIRDGVDAAARAGADLVVLPELVVTGYPPRDLLLSEAFVRSAMTATADLAKQLADGPPVILGSIDRAARPTPHHPGLLNAAMLLQGGRIAHIQGKRLLPSYDVFHEHRWFVPGGRGTIDVAGRRLGLLVCEDLWDEHYTLHPPADCLADGAELLVCISASPYRQGIGARRLAHARRPGARVVYVNGVGANDELIFDGGSFAVDDRGRLIAQLPRFEETVRVFDPFASTPADVHEPEAPEELFEALTVGVRDFARKNGLRRAFLGLSGGIDSALVACIAREALGPEWVTAIAIPSRYNDPRSTECARELASKLGIAFEVVPLDPLITAAERSLAPLLQGHDGGVTGENIQARLRLVILMSYTNRHGGMLLNTSNKTELALGYGTLYADMAGALCVIGDLLKPQVYELARWYDGGRDLIPPFILERPPSAELRPDQVDPFDYERISPIAEALIQDTPLPPLATAEEVERCTRLIRASEHKRWQSGIVLKVSEKAFGTGRLVPVTKA